MARTGYLSVICRELLGRAEFPREPEKDLVMDDKTQVEAYVAAGHVENVTLAAHLFHVAHCSETIHGARRVVDLGCGPARQLVRIAEFNPGTSFVGVDLSEEMLAEGKAEIERAGIRNVELRKADICDLSFLGDASVDGIISTMTLHHLPTVAHLARCFAEVRRVLKADGAIYLTDFCRLKSSYSTHFFSHMNEAVLPAPVIVDYEQSLKAAFHVRDFVAGLDLLPAGVRLTSTFLVPLLMIMHTPKRELPPSTVRRLQTMRDGLSGQVRQDLDDLRMFFRMGGLAGDPFRRRFMLRDNGLDQEEASGLESQISLS
ncbi:MAG: hypothetical protein C0404_10655 [Verrucomicrobia bacterium]|nr:hypothetical protein [Verrucomicrobiota bacterium]